MKFLKKGNLSIRNGLLFCSFIILIVSFFFTAPAGASDNSACGLFSNDYAHVSITEAGDLFVAGDPTGIVSLFEKNGTPVWSFSTGLNITGITISNDGNTVAAASRNGDVFGFDKRGRLLWKFDDMGCNPVVMLTRDGEAAYIFNNDEPDIIYEDTIHYLDRNGTILWEARVPGISGAAISSDGKYAVVGTRVGRNSEALVFTENGTQIGRYPAPDGIDLITLSPDDDVIGAVHSYRLQILKSSGGLLAEVIPKYRPTSVAVSSDGGIVVTGSPYLIQSFNRSGSLLWEVKETGILDIELSKNDQMVFAGSPEKVSCFTSNGTRIREYSLDGGAGSISVSADGNTVVAGSRNASIYVLEQNWEMTRISLLSVPPSHFPSLTHTLDPGAARLSEPTGRSMPTPLSLVIVITAVGMAVFVITKYRMRK